MNTKRITRREALAVGVGAVALTRAVAAPVPKADPTGSWVGKTILVRKIDTVATAAAPPDPNTPPDEGPSGYGLGEASYTVKSEKNDRIEFLLGDGTPVQLARPEVVPLSESVEFFTTRSKQDADREFALTSRGWAYYQLGKLDKAIDDFDAFLKLLPVEIMFPFGPRRWHGLVQRGLVLAELGKFRQALGDLDEAIDTPSGAPTGYLNRGFTRDLMGEHQKAIADYDAAIKLVPLYLLATNNKAWLHATCPEAKYRDGSEAVKLAKGVCERTKDREGMYLDTLAAAYAETGKFEEAVKAQEKALEDKSYVVRYGEGGEKRLQLYKDKKPFRTEPVKK